MNKWIFGAGIFCIMINFATLLLPLFVPGIDIGGTAGIPAYQENMTQEYIEFSNSTETNAESPMTDKGNLIYRVLDMINIGFIKALGAVVGAGKMLFAFPNLMMSVVGPMFDTVAQYNAIKTTLYTLFSIGYGLFIFSLWSGRDLRE